MMQPQTSLHFQRSVHTLGDIVGALVSVHGAADAVLRSMDSVESRAYRAGFNNAILSIAENFDLSEEVKERIGR